MGKPGQHDSGAIMHSNEATPVNLLQEGSINGESNGEEPVARVYTDSFHDRWPLINNLLNHNGQPQNYS